MSKDGAKDSAQSKDGMGKDGAKNAQSKDGMAKDGAKDSAAVQGRHEQGRKSGTTTGNAATSATAAPPAEKRTQIVSAISSETSIQETTNVNFNISVGTRVPSSVRFHPLPPRIVEIYPEWRGYRGHPGERPLRHRSARRPTRSSTSSRANGWKPVHLTFGAGSNARPFCLVMAGRGRACRAPILKPWLIE